MAPLEGVTELARVVIVAPEGLPIPPTKGGSVQIYLHHLTKALSALPNLDLLLVSPGSQAGSSAVKQVKVSGKRAHYQQRVLQYLRRRQPDVLQVDNRPDFALLARRMLPRTKLVLNLHSTTFLGPANMDPSLARYILKNADAVVLNSRYLKQQIERRFRLQPGQWRPHVIYPGVSLQLPNTSDRRLHHPLRILFVGRVIRQKGVHVLVGAIRCLHQQRIPVQLTIVGQTPPWERGYRVRLRQASRGLPIHWAGFVSPSKISDFYSRADIFVCPSQQNEAFGLVNVEAMTMGLPVIGSRHGGIQEIVTKDSGVLVKNYRSPNAFAAAIQHVMANPDRYEALSKGARKRAARFHWNETARRFANIYTSLAEHSTS